MVGRITTAGVVSEFPVSGASGLGGPAGITAGPDGAIWFTLPGPNVIGRMTTDGSTTNLFPIPTATSGAVGIAPGWDGNLWFTESNTDKIGQVSPTGTITEFPLTPGTAPFGIAAGPQGTLWFTGVGNNSLYQIIPALPAPIIPAPPTNGVPGQPVFTPFPLSQSCGPSAIAPGPLTFSVMAFACADTTLDSIGEMPLPARVLLSVAADPNTSGNGLVVSHNLNIECEITPSLRGPTGMCTQLVPPGTTVSLTASADPGSVFSAWTEGCAGTSPCLLTIFTNTFVAAQFVAAPSTGLLSVQPIAPGDVGPLSAGGTIVSTPSGIDCPITCTASFADGTPVTLTASPGSNNRFSGFAGSGCSGAGPCTVTISAGAESVVNATFTSITSFASGPLLSSLLPTDRNVTSPSVTQPGTATVFATIVNSGTTMATDCAIQFSPLANFPGSMVYQTTNSTTNALTGTANTPVNIPAGGSQSFVLGFTPTLSFAPLQLGLTYACANAGAAPAVSGLNTVGLSTSTTSVADIIALGATSTNDQILHISGSTGSGAFAVATFNLGAASMIMATANTGSSNTPLILNLCQTDPFSGHCISPIGAAVTVQINNGGTPTFAVFVTALNQIILDPTDNRIFVNFSDSNGLLRGGTSVAVETQ